MYWYHLSHSLSAFLDFHRESIFYSAQNLLYRTSTSPLLLYYKYLFLQTQTLVFSNFVENSKFVFDYDKVTLGDCMKDKKLIEVNALFDLMIEDVSYIKRFTISNSIKK